MWVRVLRSFDSMSSGEVFEADGEDPRTAFLLSRGFVESVDAGAVEVEDGGEVPAGS